MKKTYLYLIIVLLFIPCMAQEDLPLARYNDLRFRNGLAYKDGQLFTGILLDTFLINNRPVTIGQFKDGKKNSLFVERFSPDKKKYEGLFVEGKKEGAHFEWYENGNMKSEANYSEDEMNGKVSRLVRVMGQNKLRSLILGRQCLRNNHRMGCKWHKEIRNAVCCW